MSSLAFDDVQEEGIANLDDYSPALHVVQARPRSQAQFKSPSLTALQEDVISITGRFTVSF